MRHLDEEATVDRRLRKRPIQRQRVSEVVMTGLLDYMQGEKLVPGDRLPSERQLMDMFEVGRPAIREALQGLERLGFVVISHGERARISELSFGKIFEHMGLTTQHLLSTSEKMMDDMKAARLMFERQMARRAAELATLEDVAGLREVLEMQTTARRNGEYAQFMRHDAEFHTQIARIGGNTIYPAISVAILGWLQRFHLDQVRVSGIEDLTLSEHRALLEAVAKRDPDAAEEALVRHLTRSNKLYQRHVRRSQVDAVS